MGDASGTASLGRLFLKDEHVSRAGRLRLDEAGFLLHRNDAEYFLIKSQRSHGIANSKSNVRQTVGWDCSYTCSHSPNEIQDQRPLARARVAAGGG